MTDRAAAPRRPTNALVLDLDRGSGRFSPVDEEIYHQRKLDELRTFASRTWLTLPILILGLWIWDWATDPVSAPRTLILRIGMAACMLPCIIAIRRVEIPLRVFTLLVYATVLAAEIFWFVILRRLNGGMLYGIGGSLYFVLGMLVIGLPLRFRDNVVGLSISLITPTLAALAGFLPGFSLSQYNTLILPAGGLSLYTVWAFDRLYRRLFSYQRGVEQLAGEDALTGLPNRRQFMRAGEQMLDQARRYGRAASVLVIDLDHFKSVNDRFGHAAGDALLKAVGQLLRDHQRAADLPARLGGEEFAMLLPETDVAGALTMAERLRAKCEALRVDVPGGVFAPVNATMSVGAAGLNADDRALDDLLRRSDAALYSAKQAGRNRVERAI
jgi:diguanylate cyclase (GGDEF)-like protein